MKVQTENKNFIRDTRNKALLNNNRTELLNHKKKNEVIKERFDMQENRISKLEQDLEEMKILFNSLSIKK